IVPLVGPQSAGHVAGPGTAVGAPLGRVRARLLRLAAGSDLATAVRAVVDHLDVPAVISTAHVVLLLVVAPGASRRRQGSGWSRRQPVRGSPAAAAGSVSDATDVPIRARRQPSLIGASADCPAESVLIPKEGRVASPSLSRPFGPSLRSVLGPSGSVGLAPSSSSRLLSGVCPSSSRPSGPRILLV